MVCNRMQEQRGKDGFERKVMLLYPEYFRSGPYFSPIIGKPFYCPGRGAQLPWALHLEGVPSNPNSSYNVERKEREKEVGRRVFSSQASHSLKKF